MSKGLREKREIYKFEKFAGITLISLVITIVVLIILAGIAIYMSLGNNGIFRRAQQAKEETNKQTATEKINLKITTAQMNKYAEKQVMPTLKELSEVLKEDSEIQYVTENSKVASAEYDVPSENPTSIYTKLNEYPYEFEINSALQLASIDGVKLVADSNDMLEGSSINHLTTVDCGSSTKNIGTYNMESFSRDEKDLCSNYMEYDTTKNCYTIKKSGWYIIYSRSWVSQGANKMCVLNGQIYINNNLIIELFTDAANDERNYDSSSLTVYLTKGDEINCSKIITTNANDQYNGIQIKIFSMSK